MFSFMADEMTPRTAVQRYLNWIADPESVVDKDAVENARRAFLTETDQLSRLHAAAALETALKADEDQILEDFVTNARAYAEEEDIPVEAFQALKVPDEVLTRAGFSVARSKRGQSRSRRGRRSQRPSVSVGTIKEAVGAVGKRFTLAELAEAAGGGAQGTLKKAVDELVAEGKVTRVGPDPDHAGRGRAPILYEKS